MNHLNIVHSSKLCVSICKQNGNIYINHFDVSSKEEFEEILELLNRAWNITNEKLMKKTHK